MLLRSGQRQLGIDCVGVVKTGQGFGQPGSCHGGAGPDLGNLRRDFAFCLQRVKGVLQAQEISLRQAKKFAQAQIAVGGNIACAFDDGVNAIGRHANGMGQPVLAYAQFIEKFQFQDFTGMRVMQQGHGTSCLSSPNGSSLFFISLVFSVIVDNLYFARFTFGPQETNPPLVINADR